MPNADRSVDPSYEAMYLLSASQLLYLRGELRAAFAEASSTLAQELEIASLAVRSSKDLSVSVAEGLLRLGIDSLHTHAESIAQIYSAGQWLWYLRRLNPGVFSHPLSIEYEYDSTLTEILSCGSQRAGRDFPPLGGQPSYPITPGVVRNVLRLCAFATAASAFHSMQRELSAGADFRFRRGQLPTFDRPPEVEEAIKDYEKRLAHARDHESGSWARAGIHALDIDIDLERAMTNLLGSDDPAFLGAYRLLPPELKQDPTLPRFALISYRPSRLLRFLRVTGSGPATELAALLLLARSALYLSIAEFDAVALMRLGYVAATVRSLSMALEMSFQELRDLVVELAPELDATAASIIAIASDVEASAYPLSAGKPLRIDGRWAYADVRAVTLHVLRATNVTPPLGGGEIANLRSRQLELDVQAMIESSPWKPSDRYRALRGRSLRVQGQVVTDLDAIGEYNSRLLLVDMKSWRYTDEYDAGGRERYTRGVDLVKASEAWQIKVGRLRETLVGDNFDFRGRELIGVMCTPFPVFTPSGSAAVEVAPGLRSAASVSELADWLTMTARPGS